MIAVTAFSLFGERAFGEGTGLPHNAPLHFVVGERSLIDQVLFSTDILPGHPHSLRGGGVVQFFIRSSVISAICDDLEAASAANGHHLDQSVAEAIVIILWLEPTST